MKQILHAVSLCISLLVGSLSVFGVTQNFPYISPTPDEIPIIATSPYLEWTKPTLDDFKGVKECGFNCVLCSSLLDVKSILSLCEQVGIKAIISQGNATPLYYLSLVDSFKNMPSLGGWALKDEAGYGLWHPEDVAIPQNERKFNLIQLYDDVITADSRHLVYLNQSAGSDKFNIGMNKDYMAYLNEFQKVFTPALWSFDVYPIRAQGEDLWVNYKWFYESLINFSKISKATNRPFWAYCLSQGYTMPQKKLTRPNPTLGMLRFEAFTSLAMGAKGIVYWTYAQREESKSTMYLGAPVDSDGQRTEIWSLVQEVNKEIRDLKDVFLYSVQRDYAVIGNDAYDGNQNNSSFGHVSAIKTRTPGILISELCGHGINYLILVNQSPISAQNLEMILDCNADVVCCFGTYNHSLVKGRYEWKVGLEPGGCLILSY